MYREDPLEEAGLHASTATQLLK